MIDVTKVQPLSWVDLAESFWLSAREFYKDPKNREAYEKWAAERKEKMANAAEK